MVMNGMELILGGQFGEGLKEIALGQVKIYLQTPTDASLYAGGENHQRRPGVGGAGIGGKGTERR